MNLTKLKYFVVLAECKNITKAAAKLYIAQSNLSKQMSQLERETGVQLFIRTHTGVELTDEGQMIYDKLKHVPELIENAFFHAKHSAEIHLAFNIGMPLNFTFDRGWFTALEEMNPEYRFSIERRSVNVLREELMRGAFDAVITLNCDVAGCTQLTWEPIRPLTLTAIVSADHPMAGAGSLEALKNERFACIAPECSRSHYDMTMEVCRSHGFEPRRTIFTDSYENLILNVETRLTAAVIATNAPPRLGDGIAAIPLDSLPQFTQVVARETANRNPRVQDLIAVLRDGGRSGEIRP